METYERVVALAAEHSGIDRPIGPLTPVGEDGLELDSLDKVQFTLLLEEEFGIEISDEETDRPELGTIGGLVEFVQNKLDAKPAPYEKHDPFLGRVVGSVIPVPHPALDGLRVVPKPHHKGPMTLAEIMEAEGSATVTGTLTLTDAMATATVDLRDQDIEEVAERGRAELANSGVLGVVPRLTTSTDIEPFLESIEPGKADFESLSAIAYMADHAARHHAKRIFEAGFECGRRCEVDASPTLESAWAEFARDNGFKP